MEIMELLDVAGIPYEMKESDNIYCECPNCGKNNLSINSFTGAWHCWSLVCEQAQIQGGPDDLQDFLGLNTKKFTPSKAPPKIKTLSEEDRNVILAGRSHKAEIIKWAVSRSLDPEFVMKCGVGYWPEKKAILIPFRDEKGNLVGARARSVHYDTQWTIGFEPDLYIIDPKDLTKAKLIYVEGEPDTMTLKQFGLPVVGILGSRKDNWYGLVKKVKEHYIGFDADPSGDAGATKTAKALGAYRCKRIKWTRKDPNDMLKDGAGFQDFLTAIKQATPMLDEFVSKKAVAVIDAYLNAKTQRDTAVMTWGFPSLNKFTKGIHPGWVIMLLAEGGAGKTSFLVVLCVIWIMNGGKVGFASYEEHPVNELMPKIIAAYIGRNPMGGDYDPREIEAAKKGLEGKLFLNDEMEEVSETNFCNWVRELYYVHGVRFILADYLQLVMEDESSPAKVKRSCYKMGKNLVKEMPDLVIVWASQPKLLQKQMVKGEKKRATIDGDDIRGGSPVKQSCDVLLLMSPVEGHSDITQYQFDKVRGQLKVSKKDWLNKITQLQYDHGTLRMYEIKNLIYGGSNGN